MYDNLVNFLQLTAFNLVTWQMCVMWIVVLVLFYLAVFKEFEPLLLVPIAFGALIANLPTQGVVNQAPGPVLAPFDARVVAWHVRVGDEVKEGMKLATLAPTNPNARDEPVLVARSHGKLISIVAPVGAVVLEGQPLTEVYSNEPGGLFYYLSKGIHWELFPPLIFLGVGALTDFGPLIARPITLLLGGAAQLGVAMTFLGATLLGFSSGEAASIGIIGGADGPTAIFTANKLAPHLLSAIAVAAYSYMSLVPLIQPPIMRLLTTKKERLIRMKSLRPVSKLERLLFAVLVTVVCILLVPAASALIAMLMLGNFLRECGVTDRLVKASQNEIINVITIFLGTSVGMTMTGEAFLRAETLKIIGLGVVAFGISTAGGILMAKVLNLFLRNDRINPLIGSAGVSAVPMAARVSHVEGQKYDTGNYLLMHAMGPNVAGVIGTAVIAGYYIATLGGH
ncbi:MAG TPA: sodium ion-translocating decarboxylase subunit beta [Opitutaceae bacterium]|jgi:sodium ion-translocating decarboxylase beta subunit|nr:sodium ion-translocating decarboxylase subunit beta [Opitutaceae bacterium]